MADPKKNNSVKQFSSLVQNKKKEKEIEAKKNASTNWLRLRVLYYYPSSERWGVVRVATL